MIEHREEPPVDPGARPGPPGPADASTPPPGYRILLGRDAIVSLSQAAGLVPPRRGRKTHVSTLFRWSTAGCRGVVMPTIQCGGTRCTSVGAIQWFFERLSEAGPAPAGREADAVPTHGGPPRRRPESEEAGRRLEQMGA